MHRRSRAKWRLSLVDSAKEVLEPLDRAHDPLRLSARVEGIERGDRSMQQCPCQRLRGHRRLERPAHPLRQPLPRRLLPVGPPHAATRPASAVARPHHRRVPRTGPGRLGVGGTDEPMAGRGRRRPRRPRGVLRDQILARRGAQCARPASDLRSAYRHERHLSALWCQHLGLYRLRGVRRCPVPGLRPLRVRRTSPSHSGLLRLPSGERQGPVPLPNLDSLPRLRVITRPV
jgi:hypothetical protein